MRFCCAVILLAILIGGCGRDETVLNSRQVELDGVPDRFVVVCVRDEAVTAGDLRRRLDLEASIYARRKAGRQGVERDLAAFRSRRAPMILPELLNQRLIACYLKDGGLEVPADASAAAVKRSLKAIAPKCTLEKAAEGFDVDPAYLRGQLLAPERVRVAREHFDPSCAVVSEQEVDEGLARQDRYYERAVASNRVTWATCSNALAKVKGGMDFAAAGRAYAGADKSEAEVWDTFEADDIENVGLRTWAFSAPVGSVGGPFDIEDGLCIVKILSRKEGTMSNSVVSEGVAEVKLARINFNMVVEEPEPRTRAFVRDALLKWKGEQAQKALFARLHGETAISYPNGTNLCFKGVNGK